MSGNPLTPADLYHTGFIVGDIDEARDNLTKVAGYSWTDLMDVTLPVTTPHGESEIPFKVVYSLEAPHLELIQEVPGTLWTRSGTTAAHHVGFWVDDLRSTARFLENAGYRQEARLTGDGLSLFAYYVDVSGVRIEIVDRAIAANWPPSPVKAVG
jgi:catechol 2,3-dioxygenase-like lactoylglutathione lyase family enzyme